MRSRIELDDILRAIVESPYRVYFDPPKDEIMSYPCIRYSMGEIDSLFADDKPFVQTRKYTIVTIDEDPDSELPVKVSQLPNCRHVNHQVTDGLHQDFFTLNW